MLPVTLEWQVEFGLWLRQTPTQKRRERSQLTLQAYERDIALMGAWFEALNKEAFQPGQINSMDLKAYFAALEKEAKPATYNRRLASVRMLITWSRSVGLLDYDPAEWIPFVDATRKSPRDVSSEEYARLEAAVEAGEGSLIGLRDSVIFHLMGAAGLRINEVVTLKLSDLHLDAGYIHVHGKGGKHREVKVGSKLTAKINTWLERMPEAIEGTVVTDEKGLSIGRGQAWRRFGSIAEKAGVHTTPHAMRHTFVLRYMDAYMRGDPWRMPAAIDAVCQQTGDRPEVILAYYTRARESDMRAAAEVM
jgi:site-specific recombinase XerD